MNAKKNRTHVVLAAAVALLLMLAPQVALAGNGGGGSLQVAGCVVSGSTVTVTVANEAMSSGSATVVVEVLFGTERARTTAQIHVKAGQAAQVSFQFHGVVSDVVVVGITEDQNPF